MSDVHWSEAVPLSPLQYELVRFLLDEGRPVTRQDIGFALYGHRFTDDQVYNVVRWARRKLERYDAPADIESRDHHYVLVEA